MVKNMTRRYTDQPDVKPPTEEVRTLIRTTVLWSTLVHVSVGVQGFSTALTWRDLLSVAVVADGCWKQEHLRLMFNDR